MKTGFVALVGLPNAGKSTLVNQLIGEKVGIVSKKPQTTRQRVIGVWNDEESQICFIDTPGRIQASAGLNAFLQNELSEVIKDADVCIAVLNIDAEKMDSLLEIVNMVQAAKKPWFIVINKVDLDIEFEFAREHKLREALRDCNVSIVSCSALKKSEKLRDKIIPLAKELLPDSPAPLYTDDIYTTQTLKEMAAEVVREKCFEYLHQEVPYGLAVKVMKYDESAKMPKIYVDIIVAKENFVSMVVGKGGAMIKRIGASSRIDFEKIVGKKVYLETHVKVKKDWFKSAEAMKELGYVAHD